MKKMGAGPPTDVAMDSLIGRQTEILGDVRFTGGLHVDGKIKGNVTAAGRDAACLWVSESGTVEGNVEVPAVVLSGAIIGDVRATEHLTLAAKARVTGDVHYRVLQIEAGAMVNGQLIHDSQEVERSAQAGKELLPNSLVSTVVLKPG